MPAKTIRDYLLFAIGGIVCAAIVLATLSGFERWTAVLGMLCLVVLCLIRSEAIVYLILLNGLFFTPLYSLSFRLMGVLILPGDVLSLLAVVLYFVRQKKVVSDGVGSSGLRTRIDARIAEVFLLVMLIASIQGAVRGNYWKSVLRETKLCLYYGLIPIFSNLLAAKTLKLRHVFIWLIALSTLGSLYDIYCRIFDIYSISAYSGGVEGAITYAYTPSGAIVRDYGWVSTFHYQVFAFLCAIILFLNEGRWRYKALYLILAIVNLGANLLTITRGFVVAFIIGSITMVVLEGAKKGARMITILPRIVLLVLLVIGVVYAVLLVFPQAKWAFYRTLSLIRPEYAGRGDTENAKVRLASIELGMKTSLEHPVGEGFGITSSTGEETARERLLLSLLYHNSLGYILYTFGLVGGVVVLGSLGWIFLVVVLMFRRAGSEDRTILTMIAAGLAALFSMSFTSGNFLFAVGSVLPFVIFLFGAVRYCQKKEMSVRNAKESTS